MNSDSLEKVKAALFCAAFLFYTEASANAASFASVKQKAMELLLQKKKSQAMQELIYYIKTDTSHNSKTEANELLVKMAQRFIYREAQEAYETSINLTLDNAKEAMKSNNQCLMTEPQQLECLVQKTRLLIRTKNYKDAEETIAEIKKLVPNSVYENWLDEVLLKNKAEFKNKQIIKYIPEKNSEEGLGLILLELDRCFAAKNYSRARDLIRYFEKNYSDWPDLLFYKYKLDHESSEEKASTNIETNNEQLVLYKNKCKGLSKTTARKFRYDFDLCAR